MKKVFLFLMMSVIYSSVLYSQSNNPYNNIGVNVTNAIVTLTNDFKKGKLSDYSQITIGKYKNQFGIDATIPQNLVSSLYTTAIDANFNYVNAINNSSASQYVKTQTLEIINITKNADQTLCRNNIVAKVDEINQSNNSQADKELLLTTCASLYNISVSTGQNLSQTLRNEEGSGWGAAIGIAVGYLVGTPFCGPVCGFVGSVVFGFIGAIVGGNS